VAAATDSPASPLMTRVSSNRGAVGISVLRLTVTVGAITSTGSVIRGDSSGPLNAWIEGIGLHAEQWIYTGGAHRGEVRRSQAQVTGGMAALQTILDQVTLQVRVSYEAIGTDLPILGRNDRQRGQRKLATDASVQQRNSHAHRHGRRTNALIQHRRLHYGRLVPDRSAQLQYLKRSQLLIEQSSVRAVRGASHDLAIHRNFATRARQAGLPTHHATGAISLWLRGCSVFGLSCSCCWSCCWSPISSRRSPPNTTDAYVQAYVVQSAASGRVALHAPKAISSSGDLLLNRSVFRLSSRAARRGPVPDQTPKQLAAARAEQRQVAAETEYARAVHEQETAIYQKKSTTERKYLDAVQKLKAGEAARQIGQRWKTSNKGWPPDRCKHASVAQVRPAWTRLN
jgi:hypothetical protein